MNGYVCFWKSQRIEVYANTTYEAQQKAKVIFGARCKKGYEINVVLAEKAGQPVVHTADF